MGFGIWDWNLGWNLGLEWDFDKWDGMGWEWDLTPIGIGILPFPLVWVASICTIADLCHR